MCLGVSESDIAGRVLYVDEDEDEEMPWKRGDGVRRRERAG